MKKIMVIVLLMVLLAVPLAARAQAATYRIFGSAMISGCYEDGSDYVGGVEFQSSEAGTITGLYYYKPASDPGHSTLNLWAADGTKLAEAIASNETAPGWRYVPLTEPVRITAGTSYIASTYDTDGEKIYKCEMWFSDLDPGFPITNGGPLSAISGRKSSVFYDFPSVVFTNSFTWVDVSFESDVPPVVTPTTGPGATSTPVPTITPTPGYLQVVPLSTGEPQATFLIERSITYGDIAVVVSVLVLLAFIVVLAVMQLPRKYL